MSQSNSKRGRVHNAAGAREAILNAAEHVFAERGFDGARIDTIAEMAGYAKGLIFQYFGDKLALYREVINRANTATRDMHMQPIAWVAEDATALHREQFASLLKRFLGEVFDWYVQHPQTRRILIWEMANGWQTYAKMISQLDASELEQIRPLLSTITDAGLLHADFDPMIQFVKVETLLMIFQACIPLFQLFLSAEDLPSPEGLSRARAFIIEFIARGLLSGGPEQISQA